jgi:lysophospholipid acyltransferase (LPLAT)-like uncharacterized protein
VIHRVLSSLGTLWVRSLRPRFIPPQTLPSSGILVLWHGDMLPCLRAFAGRGMRVLISRSRDGDWGARAAENLGYRVVRGSSSSGGVAVRGLARDLKEQGGWAAFVADGPRGPRAACKPGAVWLSRETGVPVTCVVARAPWGITLGGWAKVRVPLPCSRVEIRLSSPFHPATSEGIDRTMEGLISALTEHP